MRKAAGYTGVVNGGASGRERMRKRIEAWCAGHETVITEWLDPDEYGDLGAIAYGNWLNGRKVDAVVIPDGVVAGWDVCEFYAYKAVLRRRHSDLLVACDGELFSGADLGMLDRLLDEMCRIDRENAPIRTNNGRIDKAARGAYIGGRVPTGYRAESGKLVVNPDEAKIVEFIFDRKRTGKTMLSTVDALNAGGYRTKTGKKFGISTVQSIWNNEMFYKGYYRYSKGDEWVKGQHEAILKG